VEHSGERAWRTGSSPPGDLRSGVTEKSIRKLVGPSKPVENEQLALPAIPTTTEKPTSGVSSASPSGGEGNRATQSTENKADDRDPITAPEAANDDEPGIVFEVGADITLAPPICAGIRRKRVHVRARAVEAGLVQITQPHQRVES
jgi:hypothetical protein